MLSNQEALELSLKRVMAIRAFIKNIFESNEKVFSGNKSLYQDFLTFFQTADITIERLKHPVLSIAMVGTTSAGKSTIVNGLIGRRVAPIEKKEMSAGILKLTDSQQRSVTVHPTAKASWSSGTIEDLSDEDIYNHIRGIFEKYHGHELKVAAPIIDVTGPIEWQQNKAILGLPENLGVEFIDLPGLKNVNDRKNFEVIQKILSKAFCIVAMDFNDVDPSRIQRLLEEVKDVVKAANNNTEFLLFALNKVDDVKADEETASDKIAQLKALIKESLNLKVEMSILPFVGRLYYLIQMAVIKDSITFEIVDYKRAELIKIFSDCFNFFKQAYNSQVLSKEEYRLIKKIDSALDEDGEISLDEVKIFYSICCRISEAKTLFAEIKRRINESFSHIVIRPTLDDFNKSLINILGDIDTYINISRNNSLIDLVSDKVGILRSKIFIEGCQSEDLFNKFSEESDQIEAIIDAIDAGNQDEEMTFIISRIRKDLRKVIESLLKRNIGFIEAEIESINSAINEIATNLAKKEDSSAIISYLKSQKENRVISVFNGITDVPSSVKKKLISIYLDSFRSELSKKTGVGNFIEKMNSTMPTGILKEFSNPYESLYNLYNDTLSSFTKGKDKYTKVTRTSYSSTWQNIVKDTLKNADRRVRNTLSKLSGLEFQKETGVLVGSIQKYLEKELNDILKALAINARVERVDISTLLVNALNVSKAPIKLPEDIFTFSSPYSSDKKESKYIRSDIVGYHEHSCSADEPIYKSVYENEYTYSYDNEVGCYNRWVSGIGSAEMIFWKIINEWLKDQVKTYMETIKEKAKEVTEKVDSFLDQRHTELAQQQEVAMAKLDSLEMDVKSIREQHNSLNCFD